MDPVGAIAGLATAAVSEQRAPLRILSLADVAEDPNAGAAGAEYQTIRALRELGHEVDAVWADAIGRRIAHGNLHYLLELPRRYDEIVNERLTRGRYDVVHLNQPHGFRAARSVQRRWPEVAVVHRSHGFEPRVHEVVSRWERVHGAQRRAAWRRAATGALHGLIDRHNTAICRWADGHLLCSTQDAAFMRERFSVADEKIAVVTHAAPDDYLSAPVAPLTAERLRHVSYVGQFAFVKAPHIVAEAMNAIAGTHPDVRFTWVAAGADHGRIRALLADPARVALLDWMPQGELRAIYDAAGVFLFPSYFEGTGKASIEALSRGLCVVASDVGGMHDMIEHDRSGILVPPGNAEAVAAAVRALLDDPGRAARIAEHAAARARQFTWRLTAERTAAFYRARIAAKRAAGGRGS
ncbi:MAG TPA: glycosyltransferase family 4 protein [Thermoanaerobaculia bacterium]|nr:glycosyltransferase family 4 protein [Thermoanaerobaculia bacterium]